MMMSPPMLEGIYGNYCPPSNWTLVQEWRTNDADMSGIDTYFGAGMAGILTFAWSPDGTKLTIGNADNSFDEIGTFACSTPFDPDTAASSPTGTPLSLLNPVWSFFVGDGTTLYTNGVVGDFIRRYDLGTAYEVTSGATLHSDITKTDVDLGGNLDAPFTPGRSGLPIYWQGAATSPIEGAMSHLFGSLDLDAISHTLYRDPSFSPNDANDWSMLSTNNLSWYAAVGVAGVYLITIKSEGALETPGMVATGPTDISASLNGWDPDMIWIDPLDTTYVWVAASAGTEFQMAKWATNCG